MDNLGLPQEIENAIYSLFSAVFDQAAPAKRLELDFAVDALRKAIIANLPQASESVEDAIEILCRREHADRTYSTNESHQEVEEAQSALLSAISADRQRAVEEATKRACDWMQQRLNEQVALTEAAERCTRLAKEKLADCESALAKAEQRAIDWEESQRQTQLYLDAAEQREKELRALLVQTADEVGELPATTAGADLFKKLRAALGEQHG